MMEIIHMTAAYSNAVLLAILPHVSDFSKKLGLPLPQPVTAGQVVWFRPSAYKGSVEGGLILSNRYWYAFANGCVQGFRTPDNAFYDDDPARAFLHSHSPLGQTYLDSHRTCTSETGANRDGLLSEGAYFRVWRTACSILAVFG